MKSDGKKFEEDWKESIPAEALYIRLKDDMGGFAGVRNMCDCIIFKKPTMFTLELKSHKGISVPFDCISKDQIIGLHEAGMTEGVIAGVVFNFRELQETYFVPASLVSEFYFEASRKSFPVKWCSENGTYIHGNKRITRHRYDIDDFIERAIEKEALLKNELQSN